MEFSKTGTVEILQHVATTPTVSKHFVPGTIMMPQHKLDQYRMHKRLQDLGTFTVLGHHRVFKFIGDYLSVCKPANFTAYSDETVVDDPEVISYLRQEAQKHLGSLIQEIEEGVFDD